MLINKVQKDGPTSLTATPDFGKVVLQASKSTDPDYLFTRFYVSSTNSFGSASVLEDSTSNKWTHNGLPNKVNRYYWATYVDKWDNESERYPTTSVGINAFTPKVDFGDLEDDSVREGQIKNNAVGRDKIVNDAINVDKLENNAVIRGKIINDAINVDKLENNAVETRKILAKAITGQGSMSIKDAVYVRKSPAKNWNSTSKDLKKVDIYSTTMIVDNLNPSPVYINITYNAKIDCTGASPSSGGSSDYLTKITVSLEAKKGSGAWKTIKTGIAVQQKYSFRDTLGLIKLKGDVPFTHIVKNSDAGLWYYRIKLSFQHERGTIDFTSFVGKGTARGVATWNKR